MSDLQNKTEDRKQAVAEFCFQAHADRKAMASRTKKERMTFLKGVRRSVNAQLRDTRNDLAGARAAWAGDTA
jgi:hypothetical protein